jgi:predicted DNA-binding transcriptional regulator YafY
VLRRGRWTVEDIAAEIGVKGRTIYRLFRAFKAAGITIELTRERQHAQGMATGYYTIPAEPLRRLLRL